MAGTETIGSEGSTRDFFVVNHLVMLSWDCIRRARMIMNRFIQTTEQDLQENRRLHYLYIDNERIHETGQPSSGKAAEILLRLRKELKEVTSLKQHERYQLGAGKARVENQRNGAFDVAEDLDAWQQPM